MLRAIHHDNLMIHSAPECITIHILPFARYELKQIILTQPSTNLLWNRMARVLKILVFQNLSEAKLSSRLCRRNWTKKWTPGTSSEPSKDSWRNRNAKKFRTKTTKMLKLQMVEMAKQLQSWTIMDNVCMYGYFKYVYMFVLIYTYTT